MRECGRSLFSEYDPAFGISDRERPDDYLRPGRRVCDQALGFRLIGDDQAVLACNPGQGESVYALIRAYVDGRAAARNESVEQRALLGFKGDRAIQKDGLMIYLPEIEHQKAVGVEANFHAPHRRREPCHPG